MKQVDDGKNCWRAKRKASYDARPLDDDVGRFSTVAKKTCPMSDRIYHTASTSEKADINVCRASCWSSSSCKAITWQSTVACYRFRECATQAALVPEDDDAITQIKVLKRWGNTMCGIRLN